MEQEKKRCPYCGEEILSAAKKCKHCGEWLETENNPENGMQRTRQMNMDEKQGKPQGKRGSVIPIVIAVICFVALLVVLGLYFWGNADNKQQIDYEQDYAEADDDAGHGRTTLSPGEWTLSGNVGGKDMTIRIKVHKNGVEYYDYGELCNVTGDDGYCGNINGHKMKITEVDFIEEAQEICLGGLYDGKLYESDNRILYKGKYWWEGESKTFQFDVTPSKSSSRRTNSSSGSVDVLSIKKLSESDLYGKTKKELEIMRNSIYARHGYKFKRKDLTAYFSQFSWYIPVTGDMSAAYRQMSDIEKYNVEFIKKHE